MHDTILYDEGHQRLIAVYCIFECSSHSPCGFSYLSETYTNVNFLLPWSSISNH